MSGEAGLGKGGYRGVNGWSRVGRGDARRPEADFLDIEAFR